MAKQNILVGQLADENMSDFIKFRIYVGLGSERSLDRAYKLYYETTAEPSPLWHTLAEKNQWDLRAAEYDKTVVPKTSATKTATKR